MRKKEVAIRLAFLHSPPPPSPLHPPHRHQLLQLQNSLSHLTLTAHLTPFLLLPSPRKGGHLRWKNNRSIIIIRLMKLLIVQAKGTPFLICLSTSVYCNNRSNRITRGNSLLFENSYSSFHSWAKRALFSLWPTRERMSNAEGHQPLQNG